MSDKIMEPIDASPLIQVFQELADLFGSLLWKAEQDCLNDKPHPLISSKAPCKHYQK